MSNAEKYQLKNSYPQLYNALETKTTIIETELAERSLQKGLFGSLGDTHLAQTVGRELISLIQVSLLLGDLSQFHRTIEWEINVTTLHHQLYKLNTDLALLDLLQELLLKHLDASLSSEIANFVNELRDLYRQCWQITDLTGLKMHTLN